MHVLIQVSAPCLLFPDLRKCVVVVLRAAQKLIARVFTSSDSGVATDALVGFWETSGATLAPLAEALATTETLAAAELAAPLGRFLRTLFRSIKSDPTAPAALYAFYAKVLLHAKPSQSGCAFRPTETVVLREVALLLEEWEGAKDMQVDSVVLAKVFAAQQHIKTDINSLSAVLSSPLNAGAAAKAAAEGCLGAVVTHRGASNYILAVTQLPPNKEVVQTVITQLIPGCKSLSLQRCMCTIIHKSLPVLGLSAEELNDLYALFEAATRVGESFSSYAGLRGLFEDLIAAASASSVAAPVPAALPAPSIEEGERSDGNGNGSRHLVAIKEADLTAYLVETKIKWSTHLTAEAVAPVLAALGPVVFAEVASTGRLDSLLPELVVSEVCASLRSAMAQYLKEQLVCLAALFSKTVAPSHEWSRAVTFCSCVAELAAQGRCAEFREVLAPEAQCELAAAVLGQFVRREGVAATESPSDLIAVFAFTSTALFGLVPPPLPRHPGDEESAAGNPLVSPLLRSIIEPLYEIYQNVVIAQSVQRFEPVKQLKQGVDNTEAKLLNLLAFLVISNATDSNSINTSFGPSFLRSFEALLLTLARLFPSLFYPIISVITQTTTSLIIYFLFIFLSLSR